MRRLQSKGGAGYLQMKPGRELDALIAEKVMGIPDVRRQEQGENKGALIYGKALGGWHYGDPVPHYSSDIAAAWTIIEKLRSNGYDIALDTWKQLHDNSVSQVPVWRCFLFLKNTNHEYTYFATLAPHAICLAAPKACGVEV